MPATPSVTVCVAERVELRGDEVELRGKIAEDERRAPRCGRRRRRSTLPRIASASIEERKQRQQRVVRDRRRVGEVVAVVEAEEAAPARQAGQARDVARAPADRARVALTRVIMSGRSRRLHPRLARLRQQVRPERWRPATAARRANASRRSGGVVTTTYAAADAGRGEHDVRDRARLRLVTTISSGASRPA